MHTVDRIGNVTATEAASATVARPALTNSIRSERSFSLYRLRIRPSCRAGLFGATCGPCSGYQSAFLIRGRERRMALRVTTTIPKGPTAAA